MTRFALIGCGAWGGLIAAELVGLGGVELTGVVDDSPRRAAEIAARLQIEVYDKAEHALADTRVDAVAIAVPNDLHAQVGHAALAAGKHVLLEKPMALTVAEADELTEAADRRGLVLGVDHIQRYFAPLTELRQLVVEGELGEVQAVSVARRDFLERKTPWLQQRRRVGGLLYQSGCHEFDFACWLCGEPIEITCLAPSRVIAHETLDYPDTIVTQLRFSSGAVGQVWDCMTDPTMSYDCAVTGTEGSAFVDLYGGRLRWRRLNGELRERTWAPSDRWAPWAWIGGGGIADGEAEALQALLAEFARATAGRGDFAIGGREGARVVELAQAGYLSLVEQRSVPLPLSGGDRERRTYLELESTLATAGS
jgi:predicted dehydrogenase